MRYRKREVHPDLEALSRAALEQLEGLQARSEAPLHLSLSGGSTPRRLYELMAGSKLDFSRLHLFWGDERYVPHDHPDSNYRMVKAALLDHVTIPQANVHPWPYLGSAQESAQAYEAHLVDFFGGDTQVAFDVVLLGMGDDGHTASLFPGSEGLQVTDRAAIANYAPRLDSWRLTNTYPVINRSRRAWFLVSGGGKAQVLSEVFQDGDYPSARVQAVEETRFFLDEAAAARLGAASESR